MITPASSGGERLLVQSLSLTHLLLNRSTDSPFIRFSIWQRSSAALQLTFVLFPSSEADDNAQYFSASLLSSRTHS